MVLVFKTKNENGETDYNKIDPSLYINYSMTSITDHAVEIYRLLQFFPDFNKDEVNIYLGRYSITYCLEKNKLIKSNNFKEEV
ncbi:hypothetical protein ACFL1H_05800 [Nanoarchaeota archaeon]